MKYEKLTKAQLQPRLSTLPGWRLKNEKLSKQFQFRDFITTWDFMSQVAVIAEAQNHHPDWRNVYNQVEIELSTHDAQGITEKDIQLAHAIEEVLTQKK